MHVSKPPYSPARLAENLFLNTNGNQSSFLGLKIVGSLIIFVSVLVVSIASTWYQANQVYKAQLCVNRTNEVLVGVQTLAATFYEAQTSQRGYLITGKVSYLHRYESSVEAIHKHLNHLKKLSADDKSQLARVEVLRQLLNRRLEIFQAAVKTYQTRGFTEARKLVGADSQEDNLIRVWQSIGQLEVMERTKLSQQMQLTQTSSSEFLVALVFLSISSLLTYCFLLGAILKYAQEKSNQSLIDEMTGLYNRRGFLALLPPVIKIAKRQKADCSLVFVDMDGLKTINDNLGHESGSRAIVDMAEVLRDTFRAEDLIARWGGDEFVVFAYGTGASTSTHLEERFESTLGKYKSQNDLPYRLSASMGISCFDYSAASVESVKQALNEADIEMYQHKRKSQRIN